LSIEAVIDKALKLIAAGRVERLVPQRFNVVGDHGTYNVVQAPNGSVSCSCPGFRSRGRCSHSEAVKIKTGLSRRRKVP
jgi:hypothetical protein